MFARVTGNNGTTTLAYLGRLLRGMKLKEYGAQALCDQLLLITEGGKMNPFDGWRDWRSKKIGKRLDEPQQRAMFITSAITATLEKYKFIQQFKAFHSRTSKMRNEEFETLIRDAVYTALHAEATYNDSAASKIYVDRLIGTIPQWWSPAEQLTLLPNPRAVSP